jgi:hypothetical protein
MDPSVLYQANMSMILLETIGKASSSKRTKVNHGKIEIEHCPTEQMWVDINTKPKQGEVFRTFRGHLIGIPADYAEKRYQDKVKTTPPVSLMPPVPRLPTASQECVGGNQKETNLTEDRLSVDLHAPIKIVDGCPWSPNVYCSLRLLGQTLERAWEKAFIKASHFHFNFC